MAAEKPFSQECSSGLVYSGSTLGYAPLLLPVCCICGFIRDDTSGTISSSEWLTLQAYRETHDLKSSELLFTHTYCPDCLLQVQQRLRQYLAGEEANP